MKMAKSVIISKKDLKINMWKIKKFCNLRNHFHYTGKYRGTAHSISSFKYGVPKKIPFGFS